MSIFWFSISFWRSCERDLKWNSTAGLMYDIGIPPFWAMYAGRDEFPSTQGRNPRKSAFLNKKRFDPANYILSRSLEDYTGKTNSL